MNQLLKYWWFNQLFIYLHKHVFLRIDCCGEYFTQRCTPKQADRALKRQGLLKQKIKKERTQCVDNTAMTRKVSLLHVHHIASGQWCNRATHASHNPSLSVTLMGRRERNKDLETGDWVMVSASVKNASRHFTDGQVNLRFENISTSNERCQHATCLIYGRWSAKCDY